MAVVINGTNGVEAQTGGFLADSTYGGSYTAGTVVDYTSSLGRISVGSGAALAFYRGGIANTESMRIDTNGNLYCGITSIATNGVLAKSAIAGQNFTNSNEVGTLTLVSTDSFGIDKGGSIAFTFKYNTAGGYATGARIYGAKENATDGNFAGYLGFATESGGSPVERMRIDSSGNVLIGTTTANGIITAQFPGLTSIGMSFNDTSNSGTTQAIVFRRNTTTQVGSIQTSTTNTSYVTSSDYRLKENVQPMVGALNTVAQLKPVTYDWKLDGSKGQGFIAHELQEVVPDCVTGEKDAVDDNGNPQYQGIDTSFLVATLTAAIQEQQELIKALTSRIETLEAK